MCNLSAEWVIEARRRDGEAQALVLPDVPEEDATGSVDESQPASPRRAAMFVPFPVDLLGSLLAVLLLALIGRFG